MKPLQYTATQEAEHQDDDIEEVKFEPDVYPDDFFPQLDAEPNTEEPAVETKRSYRKRKKQEPEAHELDIMLHSVTLCMSSPRSL